jgi:hypothetical protein
MMQMTAEIPLLTDGATKLTSASARLLTEVTQIAWKRSVAELKPHSWQIIDGVDIEVGQVIFESHNTSDNKKLKTWLDQQWLQFQKNSEGQLNGSTKQWWLVYQTLSLMHNARVFEQEAAILGIPTGVDPQFGYQKGRRDISDSEYKDREQERMQAYSATVEKVFTYRDLAEKYAGEVELGKLVESDAEHALGVLATGFFVEPEEVEVVKFPTSQ